MEFHIGSQAPKVPPKTAISHVFVRIKPNNFFFSVSLVEFQLYFAGFLKFYVTVLLFRKYLTSKIEKKRSTYFCLFVFFLQFYEPPDLGKKMFTTWNALKSEIYLTCINFWKFHNNLKACFEVIRLPKLKLYWAEHVKFHVKIQFFPFLTPWKICFWVNDKFEI